MTVVYQARPPLTLPKGGCQTIWLTIWLTDLIGPQAAWTSFHNNKRYVRQFLTKFHIGHLVPEEREVRPGLDEPRQYVKFTLHLFSVLLLLFTASWNHKRFSETPKRIRKRGLHLLALYSSLFSHSLICKTFGCFMWAAQLCELHCVMQGLFKVKPWYFVALFVHILALDVTAWLTLHYFGNSWGPWLAAAVMLTTAQACSTIDSIYLRKVAPGQLAVYLFFIQCIWE